MDENVADAVSYSEAVAQHWPGHSSSMLINFSNVHRKIPMEENIWTCFSVIFIFLMLTIIIVLLIVELSFYIFNVSSFHQHQYAFFA